MSSKSLMFGFALAVSLSGCGAGGAGEWRGAERDSAGIAIVENPSTALWGRDGGWRHEEELRIGALAGDPAYQFGRITGLTMDAAGRIYVLDQQAQQVRVFDAEGAHLFYAGGPGSGPGEMSPMAAQVLVLPDEGRILVPDAMLQRVSRFTQDGQPDGSFDMRMDHGIAIKTMAGSEGMVQQLMNIPMPGADAAAFNRLVARDAAGSEPRVLVELPPSETFQFRGGAPEMRIFAPTPMWTVLSDGRLVTGKDSELRLEIRSPEGEVERIFTMPYERRRLTQSDQDAYREAIVSMMEDQGLPGPVLRQMADMMQFAEHLPAFANILGGPDGTIWLQRPQTPEEALAAGSFDMQDYGAPVWDVFDDRGRYLGPIRLPDRFSLREIHGEVLLGVWRDELDVQHVMRLRLRR